MKSDLLEQVFTEGIQLYRGQAQPLFFYIKFLKNSLPHYTLYSPCSESLYSCRRRSSGRPSGERTLILRSSMDPTLPSPLL